MLVSIHQSIGVGWGQTATRLLLALWIWCELKGSWMWFESFVDFVLQCSFVLIGCSWTFWLLHQGKKKKKRKKKHRQGFKFQMIPQIQYLLIYINFLYICYYIQHCNKSKKGTIPHNHTINQFFRVHQKFIRNKTLTRLLAFDPHLCWSRVCFYFKFAQGYLET